MTLINSSLLYIQNGEVADTVSLNRASVQLLANDVNLDSRLTTAERSNYAIINEIDSINETLGELGTSVSSTEDNVETLSQTVDNIVSRVSLLEESVSNLSQETSDIESDVSDLKALTSETSNLTLASLTLKDPSTLQEVSLNYDNMNESIIQWF